MKSSTRVSNLALLAVGLVMVKSSEIAINSKGEQYSLRKTAISEMYLGEPYEGMIEIPGNVEAEYFDKGGQDVAYNNIEANIPMPDNVIRFEENGEEIKLQINDVAASTNPGSSEEDGAIAIGMGMSGEWMRYSVFVSVSGKYLPTWRIATWDGNDGLAHVGVKLILGDGSEENPCLGIGGGNLDMEVNTHGWKTFESFDGAEMDIIEGDYVLAICLDDIMNFEINYVSFQLIEAAALPNMAATPVPTKPFVTVSSMSTVPAVTSSSMNTIPAVTSMAATISPTISPTMSPTMSPTVSPTTIYSNIESEGNLNDLSILAFGLGSKVAEQCIPEGNPCSTTIPCCENLVCYLTKTCELSALNRDRNLETSGSYRKKVATFTGGLTALLGFFHV